MAFHWGVQGCTKMSSTASQTTAGRVPEWALAAFLPRKAASGAISRRRVADLNPDGAGWSHRFPELAGIRARLLREPRLLTLRLAPWLDAPSRRKVSASVGIAHDAWKTVVLEAIVSCWLQGAPRQRQERSEAVRRLSASTVRVGNAASALLDALEEVRANEAQTLRLGLFAAEAGLGVEFDILAPELTGTLEGLRAAASRAAQAVDLGTQYASAAAFFVEMDALLASPGLGLMDRNRLRHVDAADVWQLLTGADISVDAVRKARKRTTT